MLISRVLSSSLSTIKSNKLAFLRLSYLPVASFLFIDIWLLQSQNQVVLFTGILLNIYVYSIFCIGIHRLNILGKRANHPLGNIRLKGREWSYVGYVLIIGIISSFARLVGFLPVIGEFLALVAVVYVFARFVLILPAVAVDEKLSIKNALYLTKQYHLETFILLGVIPTLTILPLYLLDYTLVSQIVVSIYTTLIMIFNVSLISQTYELLVSNENEGNSSVDL